MNLNPSETGGKRQFLLRPQERASTIPHNRRIKTLPDLQAHLQTAIELEHSTIPPYLCVLYSIKEGQNQEAAQVIKSVVLEEMLHMVLAANVLKAIGGKPSINHRAFIPTYPTYLPHSNKAFKVHLKRFSRSAINTFLKIEHPAKAEAPPEADHYQTIGQFYEAIELGLCDLADQGIFADGDTKQITPEYYYGGGGQVFPVTNLESALEALKEIVGQGEGVDDSIFDGDDQMGEVKELAHYFRFNEIHKRRRYLPTDTAKSGPTGARFDVDWHATYPMMHDPKMAKFKHDRGLWQKAHEFNRTYSALLDELHNAFNGQPQRMMQSVVGMYKLKYQAVELMKIPINDKETAGPTFEYSHP